MQQIIVLIKINWIKFLNLVKLSNKKYVWYTSYGSNVSRNRFFCYIRGGQPDGSEAIYPGCRDISLPISELPTTFNHDLYFAKSSQPWQNGGVGFIETESNSQAITYGKMYLITNEQFCDVVKQEVKSPTEIHIDFDKAILDGNLIFRGGWYGNLIFLQTVYGLPVFTFTNEVNLLPVTRPSENYLLMISAGIVETHNINQTTLVNYLIQKRGIIENYTETQLVELTNHLFR